MVKTLVIILSETRAHELTFHNFKKNVIDELNADLCLCIGVKPNYDYDNPFYKLAKYRFTYDEPDDFGDAFEYAYNILSKNRPKYTPLSNINSMFGKADSPTGNDNITYYGHTDSIQSIDDYDDDEIVIHTKNFPDEGWRNKVYGVKHKYDDLVIQQHVITYQKSLYWREFLKIKDQFLGGIKDLTYEHPGSAGILIFFRWFLLKNLIDNNLIDEYDRFVITRSDFIYQLPHPKVEILNEKYIWIPNGEHYGGYTDRHAVLSKYNIESYLNILNNLVIRSNEFFIKMRTYECWNLEQLIKFNLEQNGVNDYVRQIPYIMYSVRPVNGSTRWAQGIFSDKLGYFIKYQGEYDGSTYNKQLFEKSNVTLDDFYTFLITYSS